MKSVGIAGVFLCALCAHAAAESANPVPRVVNLIEDLKAKVQADGELEQKSYDKYACWCEKTLARKASDISTAKQDIKDLQDKIIKLKGELGSHGAEIAQLEKDIAANIQGQNEATEVRDKERSDYHGEREETEQCIGALEAAITVLTGAGGKKGFLQETQLMSVVDGVRRALAMSHGTSDADAAAIQRFVQRPDDFVAGRSSGVVSALQASANPFGDYAPQSTQIQGILKGMYDAFAADLEKANAEESESQRGFTNLMATKNRELDTLKLSLESETTSKADKTKELAEAEQDQDETEEQLKADEIFFEETKDECKVKATQWSERTRMRTMELQGFNQAIEIMTSDDAKKIFQDAHTTFLQVSSSSPKGAALSQLSASATARSKAYNALRAAAGENRNLAFARIAISLKSGGHFDKVIASIDEMMALLRTEEQDDINHRDRCEAAQKKNGNDKADVASDITKAGQEVTRMQTEETALKTKIGELKTAISSTQGDLDSALILRNGEVKTFKTAIKNDVDAMELLRMANTALRKFYKKNKIPMGLVQKAPEYTVDGDKAPEASFSGDYGGKKSESTGITAIIEMVVEDIQHDLDTAREEEAETQAAYAENRKGMEDSKDAQEKAKVTTEKNLAELQADMEDKNEFITSKTSDQSAENGLGATLATDCAWVKSHFTRRRNARKNEMKGLQEAKDYLAGVEAGSELAP